MSLLLLLIVDTVVVDVGGGGGVGWSRWRGRRVCCTVWVSSSGDLCLLWTGAVTPYVLILVLLATVSQFENIIFSVIQP